MRRIKVRFSFLLFNALFFMFRSTEMIASFYAVCLLHELGHLAAMYLTGAELRSAELSFFGIKITAASPANRRKGAAVLLSGPAVNIVLYALLMLTGHSGRLALLSLSAGLFNLLPYSSLDGGALLDMFAEGSIRERELRVCIFVLRAAVTAILAAAVIRCFLYG